MTANEIASIIEDKLVAEVAQIPLEEQVRTILSPHAWKEWQRFAKENPDDADVLIVEAELKTPAPKSFPLTPIGDLPID